MEIFDKYSYLCQLINQFTMSTFTFTCPSCGQSYEIKRPAKSIKGANISCKFCAAVSPFDVIGENDLAKGPEAPIHEPPTPAVDSKPQTPGVTPHVKPVSTPVATPVPAEPVTQYTCPECHSTSPVYMPDVSGNYMLTCAHCQRQITVYLKGKKEPFPLQNPGAALDNAQSPTVPVAEAQPTQPATTLIPKKSARLVCIAGPCNESFEIKPGITTIGRYDVVSPSDISIKGDRYMSRRSVSLEAAYNDVTGFSFRMKVIKTTNPVMLNGQTINQGETAYLNFGDIISLGESKFRLDKQQ